LAARGREDVAESDDIAARLGRLLPPREINLGAGTTWQPPRPAAPPGRKIVLVGYGTYGDLRPLVEFAKVLAARGYSPVLATAPDYRDIIRAEGVAFAPVRPSPDKTTSVSGAAPPSIRGQAVDQWLADSIAGAVIPQLEDSVADCLKVMEGAALVVAGALAYGGRLAAMKLGLPWLSAVVQPMVFLSAYDLPEGRQLRHIRLARRLLGPSAARALLRRQRRRMRSVAEAEQRVRAKLGLPGGRDLDYLDRFSPYGSLCFFSPLLCSVAPDFPPNTRILGFPRYDEPRAALSKALAAFLRTGPPPVVFSGTNLFHARMSGFSVDAFLQTCVAAARAANRRIVLLTASLDAKIAAAPDVFAAPYVPHSVIFPHAEAVIHTGGIGTICNALRAGKPQLQLPITADQPDNARRAARLSVAETVPYDRFGEENVTRALQNLLSNPQVKQRAAALAPVVQREDGCAAAAAVIDGMLMASQAARSA
jgi:UDP:flavonoid glycosyltransferase YjiC (YdhE family)